MATRPIRSPCVAFGPFEVDAAAGELRKSGVRMRLGGQPFQILLFLLAHPGQVVTREQLREQIWPEGTFVDFEHSLSAAMNKLRRALGDSAENPRFIETVPGRGYRFIGSVQERGVPQTAKPAPVEIPPASAKSVSKKTWLATGAVIGGIFVAALFLWMALQKPARRDVRVQQLTTNSPENPIRHAVISPDGKYLAYGDMNGIQVRLIATGETYTLKRPLDLPADNAWFPSAWFPDGTRILACSVTPVSMGRVVSSWTVSVVGGSANRLRDNAFAQSVSPDGSLIAFTTGSYFTSSWDEIIGRSHGKSEVWVMGPHGENPTRVVAGDALTYFGAVRWSPHGRRIVYRKLRLAAKSYADYTLESQDVSGGAPSTIISSRQSYFYTGYSVDFGIAEDFCWTPDGRIIYTVPEPSPKYRDRNLWQIAVDSNTGKARGSPRRITNLAGFHIESLSLTADGSRLVFGTYSVESHFYVSRILGSGKLEAPRRITLDKRYNEPFAWTPDSKAVIFVSDRTGNFSIYKQALEENEPVLVPTGSENVLMLRVSPDGKWLIYSALSDVQSPTESESTRLMRVPIFGGTPQLIFQTKNSGINFSCARGARAICVVEEKGYDLNQATFTSIDPQNGIRQHLFKIKLPGGAAENWMVSPDGTRLAMTGIDPQGGIEVRSLSGRIEQTISLKGWPKPAQIDWTADGKALLVSHIGLIGSPSGPVGATLLRVDFQGHVQPLWETRTGRHTWGIASPDGRYLALRGAATERNAWMIENF